MKTSGARHTRVVPRGELDRVDAYLCLFRALLYFSSWKQKSFSDCIVEKAHEMVVPDGCTATTSTLQLLICCTPRSLPKNKNDSSVTSSVLVIP